MLLGKLQRAHPTLRGHFAPACLVGSNMLRAYVYFVYGFLTPTKKNNFWKMIYFFPKEER